MSAPLVGSQGFNKGDYPGELTRRAEGDAPSLLRGFPEDERKDGELSSSRLRSYLHSPWPLSMVGDWREGRVGVSGSGTAPVHVRDATLRIAWLSTIEGGKVNDMERRTSTVTDCTIRYASLA